MNAHDFAPIHPQALAWIDRVIAGMPIFAPARPSEETRLSSIQTVASNDAEKQATIADVAIVGLSDDNEGVSVDDDKMEWLSSHASPRAVETLQHMAREAAHAREDDTSTTGRGRAGVRPDQDVIERLLASYSKQRQAVWWWCVDNASIITHDMPSARAVGKGAGVSYETARHVLTDWRNLYGLTLTPMNG